MKPFDLEAAKRGEPIVTRKGEPCNFLCHDPELPSHLRVSVYNKKGKYIFSVSENGLWMATNHLNDLFMAAKKKTVWVNVYRFNEAYHYDSQEEADQAAENCARIGGRAYPLEIEE